MSSPKSKEGCRVTERQRIRLINIMVETWGKQNRLKIYCTLKRLILLKP